MTGFARAVRHGKIGEREGLRDGEGESPRLDELNDLTDDEVRVAGPWG